MDVVLSEDDSRIRKDYGAENFVVARHIVLNLLKQEHFNKFSIKKKRYVATLNPQYFEKIVQGASFNMRLPCKAIVLREALNKSLMHLIYHTLCLKWFTKI